MRIVGIFGAAIFILSCVVGLSESGPFPLLVVAQRILKCDSLRGLGGDTLALAGIQLTALILMFVGAERELRPVVGSRNLKTYVLRRLAVAGLFGFTAAFWGDAFEVWAMTKLDFLGRTATGTTDYIADCTARCEFTTREGRTISAFRYNYPQGKEFLYLPSDPTIFKTRGQGRLAQVGFLFFAGVALWQLVSALLLAVKRGKAPRDTATPEPSPGTQEGES